MRFEGDRISRQSIPFNVFKGLVDNAYEIARILLSPVDLLGMRSSIFDFPIYKPAFSSLILSLGEPTFNAVGLSKKLGEDVDVDFIRQGFRSQRGQFFANMGEVIKYADRGTLTSGFVSNNFSVLDTIKANYTDRKKSVESCRICFRRGRVRDVTYCSD